MRILFLWNEGSASFQLNFCSHQMQPLFSSIQAFVTAKWSLCFCGMEPLFLWNRTSVSIL
ncbi:hypothetical protein JCM6294_645 [Bacteroides pyogenes DSM 20611 = JCM 6294]|uniref:Uncharacterized protein n=1 Tax=Bacteroides pyogenes DSM 20611 = JCM 6294 TaxID=1121100 RepID=W4PDJ5_9BACE|nr:hypothetical protein JCM6294_645 [Bacteroides pyogenes DSM 20611 = JCM 6294]